MKRKLTGSRYVGQVVALSALLLAAAALPVLAAGAQVGEKAPDFTLADVTGKEHRLSDYAGKTVVLEWFNPDCPFVKKHYGAGNMQALQERYTGKGVVWLTICSSAPGKQGHYEPKELGAIVKNLKGKETAVLQDPAGTVGRAYGARTTPHMFVVGGDGTVFYNGAIDSIRSTNSADIEKAVPYVAQALDETLAGKPVSKKVSQPYGCSVKY